MDQARFTAQVIAAITAVAALLGITFTPEIIAGFEKIIAGVFALSMIAQSFLPSIVDLWKKISGHDAEQP